METQIRTYKMIAATGFAPNFDGGVLTLATCKSGIRKYAQKGEWIAGFTSKTLNGDEVGQERLIFLAQISDILTYEEYWNKFPQKRPDKNQLGDNIFATKAQAERDKYEHKEIDGSIYIAIKPCRNFDKYEFLIGELKSDKVLIFGENRYFGTNNPLVVPNGYKIKVPKAQAASGYISNGENVDKFVKFVFSHENCFDVDYKNVRNGNCGKGCSVKTERLPTTTG